MASLLFNHFNEHPRINNCTKFVKLLLKAKNALIAYAWNAAEFLGSEVTRVFSDESSTSYASFCGACLYLSEGEKARRRREGALEPGMQIEFDSHFLHYD